MQLAIQDYSVIGPLGEISKKGLIETTQSNFTNIKNGKTHFMAGVLPSDTEKKLQQWLDNNPNYKTMDRSVQIAAYCASNIAIRNTIKQPAILQMGSSRGATSFWEHQHRQFIEQKNISPKSSPLTTLGNIATNTGRIFGKNIIPIEHSITCSSFFYGIANAFAWLKSEMANQALVGAAEAPVTGFTYKQMKAMGMYSTFDKMPCRPLQVQKNAKNTFVLSEGGGLFLLTPKASLPNAEFTIDGFGSGMEVANTLSGISEYGDAYTIAMQRCLKMANQTPDLIIAHAPGTLKGDKSEWNAINKIRSLQNIPVFAPKYLTGHLLGASGTYSLALAIQTCKGWMPEWPKFDTLQKPWKKTPKTILINSMGFGGNAFSVCLTKRA